MRFLRSFAIIAALAAATCASQPGVTVKHGHKMGASGPQIPATYDPSVSGYPGTVGDILQVAGGATAWVKSGTGVTDWTAFPSAGGSGPIDAVTVAANITGVSAQPSGATRAQLAGVGLAPPTSWLEARMRAIQAIAPTLVRGTEFECWNLSNDLQGATATGSATTTIITSVPGGAIKFATVTGANSLKPVVPRGYDGSGSPAGTAFAVANNPKVNPWAIVVRINPQTALTSTESMVVANVESIGLAPGSQIIGGIFAGTDTTHFGVLPVLAGSVGAGFTSNLTVTIGSWQDVAYVFDGTTLWIMKDDVKSSTGMTTLTSFMTSPGQPGRIYFGNGASVTTNREYWLAKYAVITEDI